MAVDFTSDINKDYKVAMDYGRIDGLMVKILWWHFGVLATMALFSSVFKIANTAPSPFAWRVISLPAATITVILGIAATVIPMLLRNKLQNHYHYRLIVTTCLVVYSYLFVFISGGSIEMHFHFFMIIALLIVYADWRLGWLLLLLTGLHHGILNYVEPGWVYFYGRNDFAVIAHSLPVLASVIFTTIISQHHRSVLVASDEAKKGLETTVSERTGQLQHANQQLEHKVAERTALLQQKLSEVQDMNEVMVGRELKLAEQKEELAKLKHIPEQP